MDEFELPELDTVDSKFEYSLVGGPYDGSKVICPHGTPPTKQLWFEYEITQQRRDGTLVDVGDKYHVYKPKAIQIEGSRVCYLEFEYV